MYEFLNIKIDRPGVSKHMYESVVFKSHIWTFSKDAQISFSPRPRIGDHNLHNEIDFPLIEMQMSLPPSVILYSSALRGLWLNYDHFSDYCPSFKLKIPRPDTLNILKQSKKEWRKRKEILQKMLDEYSQEVPLTELEQFDHERDLISQQGNRKRLDVDRMYLEYEDELNQLRRKAIGPAGFGLSATDVNLRKYRIIGGVYCADYLETPQQDKQLNATSFIRTIFGSNKLSPKNYYQTFKPPPPPQPGVRRLPEEIETEMRMVEAALDKLVLVTVQLPASVIWFEPPIACHWETQLETLESDLAEKNKNRTVKIDSHAAAAAASPPSTATIFSPLKDRSPIFPDSKLRKKSSQKFSNNDFPVREINDFDMLKMSTNIDTYSLIKDFIVPRMPLGFSVQINGQRLKHRKSGKKWNKPTKRLFLARSQTSVPDQAAETAGEMKGDYEKFSRKRLTEDFLDCDESRELFPCSQFEKVLKIKPSRSTNSEKTSKSCVGHKYISRYSSNGCEMDENEADETYMFSQFIEDLDRLRELQTPQLQEMLLEQISVNLNSNNHAKEVCNEAPEAGKGGAETLINVTQQPAPFGLHSVISFRREAESLKSDCEEDEGKDQQENDEEDYGDDTSTGESEYDDDYDDRFFNENLDNDYEAALTSNRSEVSGGTAAATPSESPRKEASSMCDISNTAGKRSCFLNETIFTQGKWSTRDVHDTKFNEDKLAIQFRTGRLGIFGFALNRYSNMPYQTWEIKPDTKNPDNILFSFTASLISLDVTIVPQGFCVNNFQGGSTATINEMIGKTLSLDAIKQILISSAVDIFPEEDAFCYTEGSCEKNYLMEMHLYACMSTLSLSHNFTWSRWNLLAGSRTAVLLSRELVDGKKVPSHSTLLVTPLKTSIIDCTEVSASFNSAGIPGMDYYADLYQLAQVHAQPSSLEKQRNINPILRDNVAKILMAIRPLSFC